LSSLDPGFPTMSNAVESPSTGRADNSRRVRAAWLWVHLMQVAVWAIIYLGSLAGASLLQRLAVSLRATESRFLGEIETVLKMYEDWFFWAPAALVLYALLGWISVWRAKPGGPGLRAWPNFLTFAFLLRRGPGRCRRPASGSYWKHSMTRHRWLLLLVKIHFLPLAVGSCINSFENIRNIWRNVAALETFPPLFGLCLAAGPLLVYLVDGVVATAAYSVEAKRHGSRIRAVETNWLGWLSCLVCYPPMLLITTSLLERQTRVDDLLFSMTSWPAYVCAVLGLSFFVLYGFSAINLGLRYSNLTYRGTTTWGLFRAVRHPQYSSKLLGWLFEWLPFFAFWPNMLCFLGWVAIYVTRAMTEERFLSRFEEYRAYREKVKWRFFPGVW
jgi:protein-S-isoprenylcysteine O-methyltransferase Ste14